MKSDTPSSAAVSATTSEKQRRSDERLSEADFLKREAEDAQLAILAAVDRLKTDAIPLVDVRAWTTQYPLGAIGSAALVGFLAARWITSAPGGESEERPTTDERIAELRARRRRREEHPAEPEEKDDGIGAMLAPIVKLATTAALGAIRSAIGSMAGHHEHEETPTANGTAV